MDPMEMMKDLSMEAYSELLVEKMKAAYEKKMGKRLDRIAEVAVDHAIRYWASKMERKEMKIKEMEEYGRKLGEAFMSK